jgi:hypothetical protein
MMVRRAADARGRRDPARAFLVGRPGKAVHRFASIEPRAIRTASGAPRWSLGCRRDPARLGRLGD